MNNSQLEKIAACLTRDMEEADSAREKALPLHRQSIRASSLAIRAVHRYEYSEAHNHLTQSHKFLNEASELLRPYPMIYYAGFLQDAQKEYAEASITYAVVTSLSFPTPQELGIDNAPYANGLAESVGELRRHVLDHIRRGEFSQSETLLEVMDEIFYVLTILDFPDAITRGLRRSADIARGCLEKTRGDLTANYGHLRLEKEVRELSEKLAQSRG